MIQELAQAFEGIYNNRDPSSDVQTVDRHRDVILKMIERRLPRRMTMRGQRDLIVPSSEEIYAGMLRDMFFETEHFRRRFHTHFLKANRNLYHFLFVLVDRGIDKVIRKREYHSHSGAFTQLQQRVEYSCQSMTRRFDQESDFETLVGTFDSPIDRRLLRLRYQDDLSFKTIADEFGISKEAVRQRHMKIVSKLRRRLRRMESVA